MDEKLLPEDLIKFLKEGNQLEYDPDECEAGLITLVPYDDLTLGEVYINSFESPFSEIDPHAGEKGYYAVPAVNLVVDCDGYDPEGILIWLPDQHAFGSWDNDHWDVYIFPDMTWTDITKDPVKYINVQWDPENTVAEYLRPFPKYRFNSGMPWDTK